MGVQVIYSAVPEECKDTLLYKTMKEHGYTLLLTDKPTVGYFAIEDRTGDVVKVARDVIHEWIRTAKGTRVSSNWTDICEKSVPKNSGKFGTSLGEGD